MKKTVMPRQPEPELMDVEAEAQAYAKADFADVNRRFVERLIELSDNLAAAETVDLGTGPGEIPIRLVQARPNWHVVAIDASQAMLDLAKHFVQRA